MTKLEAYTEDSLNLFENGILALFTVGRRVWNFLYVCFTCAVRVCTKTCLQSRKIRIEGLSVECLLQDAYYPASIFYLICIRKYSDLCTVLTDK